MKQSLTIALETHEVSALEKGGTLMLEIGGQQIGLRLDRPLDSIRTNGHRPAGRKAKAEATPKPKNGKHRRFTEAQKKAILLEAEKASVTEVAKKHHLNTSLVYRWRKGGR